MKALFERTSSSWVKYSEYEWKTAADGTLYLTPTATAQPSVYDPLSEYGQLVLDAISIGRMEADKKTDTEIQDAIRIFAEKYGLLGLMTALPTTPSFMDYEAVYLPKNHFIREETMSTESYLKLFFPFDKPDLVKRGVESVWSVSSDRTMVALAMTMSDKPIAVNMSFQREYAERYEWIKRQLQDITFTYLTSVIFYEDYDMLSPEQRLLMQQGSVTLLYPMTNKISTNNPIKYTSEDGVIVNVKFVDLFNVIESLSVICSEVIADSKS